MSSIIPGYEYDIFISYRQKDNKYDNWVTEFVDNLKREIEATFKEDVSIYFDENPHDGLLEIHNVNKSLENKLRSVIFMPIISQTYVDSKSFAWQNEFMAFNKLALEDSHGRDIKLASGNVCSRIIPVKIHELDFSDTELIEKELGTRLRSIDFIYSSSGVNRPLKPADNPDKNLNKTFYRDQINKVANTVKEVIYGLHPEKRKSAAKTFQAREKAVYINEKHIPGSKTEIKKKLTNPVALLLGLFLVLIISSVLFFKPGLLVKKGTTFSQKEDQRIAIAVMPVSDLMGNPDLEWVPQSIQNDLITPLSGIRELIVRPKQSTLQFRDSEASLQDIARKLNVGNLVYSSIKGTENNFQFELQLVEAFPEDRIVWSSTFNLPWKEITNIYPEIISHILGALNIKPDSQEEVRISGKRDTDPELLKACARGEFYMGKLTPDGFRKGLEYLTEAIAIDPADPLPYLKLAIGYSEGGHAAGIGNESADRAKSYALKALELDSTLADAHVVLATRYLYNEWDFEKAGYHLKKAMQLNPSSSTAFIHYGWYLSLEKKYKEAEEAMIKAVEIDPTDPLMQGYLAWLCLWTGQYQKALAEAEKTLQIDPQYTMAYYVIGSAYSELGMHSEAIEAHKKGLAISPGYEVGLAIAYINAGKKEEALREAAIMAEISDPWYAWGLSEFYAVLGDKDKAIFYVKKAYEMHQDFVPWFSNDYNLKSLFDDSRFQTILKPLKIPEE